MGNNILSLLKERDISIYKLSKDSNLHYSNVYKLVHEQDISNYSLATLVKVADVLNVSLESLYEEGGF